MHNCSTPNCSNPSANSWYGIHYCQEHYSALEQTARSQFEQAESLKHGNMVYLERQLMMDVASRLYLEAKQQDDAFDDLVNEHEELEGKLVKANERIAKYQRQVRPIYEKFFDILYANRDEWYVKALVLTLPWIPLAFAVHWMW